MNDIVKRLRGLYSVVPYDVITEAVDVIEELQKENIKMQTKEAQRIRELEIEQGCPSHETCMSIGDMIRKFT